MAKYVFRDGAWIDKQTGEPMQVPARDGLCVPKVIHDIEPFVSPADGTYVSGRAAKRDNLKANNCVDANEVPRTGMAPKGQFRNKRFASKHNLPLADEAR